MMADFSLILAVIIMALAAVSTRFAGAVFMSWTTPTPRVERFLEGLSVSVISALVASILASADVRMIVATAVAVVAAALTRSVVWAMMAGMATASSFQFF